MASRHNKPIDKFSDNTALDASIKEVICPGLKVATQKLILELSDGDKELFVDFIAEWPDIIGNGAMMSNATKTIYVNSLVYLSRYVKDKLNAGKKYKPFKEMTKDDVLDGYLRSLRRPFDKDKDEDWINTYKTRASKYSAFFRWLTKPGVDEEGRQRKPPQLKGLKFPRRKVFHSVKKEDQWTPEEHAVFLMYCHDLRLKCYHWIAMEVPSRPGELLALKIKDFHMILSRTTGKTRAEFEIGRYGKNRQPRAAAIHHALPAYNDWIAVHPMRDRPENEFKEAYLFPSLEKSARGYNKPLLEDSLRMLYKYMVNVHFKKRLDDPNVSDEHKDIIRSLRLKKNFPKLRRHEWATKNAFRKNDLEFNQLIGHSSNSRMRQVYAREAGGEGLREHLIAQGLTTREETESPTEARLQAISCPKCGRVNKHDAKFCLCGFTLTEEGVLETRAEEAKAIKESEEMRQKLEDTKKELEELKARLDPGNLDAIVERAVRRNMNQDPERARRVKLRYHPAETNTELNRRYQAAIDEQLKRAEQSSE